MTDPMNNTNLFTIVTESCGRILYVENQDSNPLEMKFEKGNKVYDKLPFLFGIFPFSKTEIFLENISFKGFFGNVLVKKNLSEVKIICYNNPESSKLWQHLLQKHNQEQLIKSIVMKTNPSSLSCNILYSLGFMTFERHDKGFELLGNIPQWFKILKPYYNYSSLYFPLEEIFPFLEVFIPEAVDLFNKKQDGKIPSGLWTEYSPQGQEIILQATAIKENGYDFIFLESISERNPEKQKNLQKLREQTLLMSQLDKTEKKLRTILKNREEFISIFSHDVRNPLAGIYSLVDLLHKDEDFMGNFNPNYARLFNVIHKDLSDLMDYTTKLYNWSNVNFGNMKLESSYIDFNSIVNSLLISLNDKIYSKKIKFNMDIPMDFRIYVDDVFFKNALMNLFTNAIKFSHPMGKISISAYVFEGKKIIKIIDEGVGMNQESMDSLFSFNKKETKTGTLGEKGTGIGLTIVKKIMDMHKAQISIKSILNQGTEIEIQLER